MREGFGIVRVERIVGRETADEGIEELVFAQGETLSGMVDGEGGVVLEEACFDFFQLTLLVFLVVGFLSTLRSSSDHSSK